MGLLDLGLDPNEFVLSSKHFTQRELSCKCQINGATEPCEGRGMYKLFMNKLEEFRVRYKPFIPNSAERCIQHPLEAKKLARGKDVGAHAYGCAVDIPAHSSAERYQILNIAFSLGFWGIAVEAGFVHLDSGVDLPGRGGNPYQTWVY